VVVGAEPSGRLRPSGVYVFDHSALEHIPVEGFQDIKERLIPRLYAAGKTVETHIAPSVAPRVVSADTYLALNEWALERASFHLSGAEGFRTVGETVVHASAEVAPTARMLGPVLVGPDVRVEAGATLVGPVSLGPGSVVRRDAVVSRSVMWSDCLVGEGGFVDRCMMADGSTVEPRQTAFSVIKGASARGVSMRSRSGRQRRAPWQPLVAALRPAAPHHP
jgi:mannose-1-phosphate guanylyltransferase